jgi:hypothetical protein
MDLNIGYPNIRSAVTLCIYQTKQVAINTEKNHRVRHNFHVEATTFHEPVDKKTFMHPQQKMVEITYRLPESHIETNLNAHSLSSREHNHFHKHEYCCNQLQWISLIF